MIIPVPSLSTYGWVKNPAEKADFALAHFFNSQKNQSSLYGSNVANLQWILEQNTGNMLETANAVRGAINTYLSRYYESVAVDVSTREIDPTLSASKMEIVLSISVTDGGINYSIDRLLTILDGRFKAFTTLNNEETT